MGPYSLTNLQPAQSQDPLGNWLIQPYQLNSAGNLPGNTTISINGQGVQISGPKSSIIVSSKPTGGVAVISVLGQKGYILFTNPTTGINDMIMGNLPDGTTGMVSAVAGIDVLSVFS